MQPVFSAGGTIVNITCPKSNIWLDYMIEIELSRGKSKPLVDFYHVIIPEYHRVLGERATRNVG